MFSKNPVIKPEETKFGILIKTLDKGRHHIIQADMIDEYGENKPSKKGLPYGYLRIEKDSYDLLNPDVFFVKSSRSELLNYGPLLYDTLMEVVTLNGFTLSSDNVVSVKACYVWSYYLNKRPDVHKEEIDFIDWKFDNREKEWENARSFIDYRFGKQVIDSSTNPLLYTYWKDPDIITRLDRLGKLIVEEGSD